MPNTNPDKIQELIPTTEVSSAPTEPGQSVPQVVEAPVLVLPPGSSIDPSNIRIDTGGGTAVSRDVGVKGDFTGRDDQRYSSAGSSVQFTQADNSKLWEASMELLQKIADVAFRLDNIPDRLERLEAKLHIQPVTVPVTFPIAPLFPSWVIGLLIVLLVLVAVGVAGVVWLIATLM